MVVSLMEIDHLGQSAAVQAAMNGLRTSSVGLVRVEASGQGNACPWAGSEGLMADLIQRCFGGYDRVFLVWFT